MTPAEQEALVLRQVAALERSGLARGQALELAWETLGEGEIAERVHRVRTALAAGQEVVGDAFAQALAAEGPELLERCAASVDARLAAEAALRTTRLYVAIGLVVPVWLGVGVAFQVRALAEASSQLNPITVAVLKAFDALGWLWPVPLVVALIAAWRLPDRFAPAVRTHERAARLLSLATAGGNPLDGVESEPERAYLVTRMQQVGAGQASTELADELSREAERSAELFRAVAPLVAAVVVFFAFGVETLLVLLPFLDNGSWMVGSF